MKVDMKHVIEIAGGLFIGGLASDVVNGVAKLTKEAIVKAKAKKGPKKL